MKAIALGLCVVVPALMWLSASAWPVRDFTESSDGVRYETTAVETAEIVKTVNTTGTVHASVTVEVGSQLSGQVSVLSADFNDPVKKGQVLLQLDQSKFKAQVEVARATLDSARADEKVVQARLERATIDLKRAEMQRAVLEARCENAKIALDKAARDVNRKVILSERGVGLANDVLDFTERRDSARVTLREAQAVLANHANEVEAARADEVRIKAELDSARYAVKRAEAQLQTANIDLDFTNVRAPIDGVIVGRTVTHGQTLASNMEAKTLFLIAGDLRLLDVYAKVDESDISRIKVGQSSTFTVDSFPGREFTAKVTQIRKAPQVVQNVVTYTVVLAVHNDDYALLPGMTVLAKITTERTPPTLSIPLSAVQFKPRMMATSAPIKQGTASVWVLKNNRPIAVPVVLGEADGDRVAIKTGDLRHDDKIIISEKKITTVR